MPVVVGNVELVQRAGERQARFRKILLASSYNRVAAGNRTPLAKRPPRTRRAMRPTAVPTCRDEPELVGIGLFQSSLVPQKGQKLFDPCSSAWHTGQFIQN